MSKTLGQISYEAYAESTASDGFPCLKWDELAVWMQNAWERAADRVVIAIGRGIPLPQPDAVVEDQSP